jgi:hypothetical protein
LHQETATPCIRQGACTGLSLPWRGMRTVSPPPRAAFLLPSFSFQPQLCPNCRLLLLLGSSTSYLTLPPPYALTCLTASTAAAEIRHPAKPHSYPPHALNFPNFELADPLRCSSSPQMSLLLVEIQAELDSAQLHSALPPHHYRFSRTNS